MIQAPASELRMAKVSHRMNWLWAQWWLGFLTWPWLGYLVMASLIYGGRFRFQDLGGRRALFRELTQSRVPLLICSNHLTYVDSILLMYIFGGYWHYCRHYRTLSWNLPAQEYSRNWFFWFIGLIGKCIFIDRGGSAKHHILMLESARTLLERGEVVTIFPEGRRSRTGRFDDRRLANGVGKIISELKECRVLCVYLRATSQAQHASFPPRGSDFRVKTELLHYSAAKPRGTVEITREIADKIKGMEAEVELSAGPSFVDVERS